MPQLLLFSDVHNDLDACRALVARAASRPVRIHVERENPARRLYERLGFECRAEEGVYLLMVRPGSPG